eukprot:9659095-Alexandrium_andersonii.AAC.1
MPVNKPFKLSKQQTEGRPLDRAHAHTRTHTLVQEGERAAFRAGNSWLQITSAASSECECIEPMLHGVCGFATPPVAA